MFKQARRGRWLPLGTGIRYRTAGGRWAAAETVDLRNSELMFLCHTPLELQAEVEILLPAMVAGMGTDSVVNLLCTGWVVRRILANWPELRSAIVVNIAHCQILSEPVAGDAHAA